MSNAKNYRAVTSGFRRPWNANSKTGCTSVNLCNTQLSHSRHKACQLEGNGSGWVAIHYWIT